MINVKLLKNYTAYFSVLHKCWSTVCSNVSFSQPPNQSTSLKSCNWPNDLWPSKWAKVLSQLSVRNVKTTLFVRQLPAGLLFWKPPSINTMYHSSGSNSRNTVWLGRERWQGLNDSLAVCCISKWGSTFFTNCYFSSRHIYFAVFELLKHASRVDFRFCLALFQVVINCFYYTTNLLSIKL